MSQAVHTDVVGGDPVAEVAAQPDTAAGWTTDADLRTHMLGDETVEAKPDETPVISESTEVASDVTVDTATETAEQTTQPSAEIAQLSKMFETQGAQITQLLEHIQKQNAAPERPAEAKPDPWARPSSDHSLDSAKAQLGDVSERLLTQYSTEVQKLTRWEGSAEDTPDRAVNIERVRGNMRELHARADAETERKADRAEWEERLSKLEKQPDQAKSAALAESTVRGRMVPEHLAADYPNLAAAATAGRLNIDAVLSGFDFGELDLNDRATYHLIDERLKLADSLMSGMSSAAPKASPAQSEPPVEGVRVVNASSIAIPDQAGSTDAPKQQFFSDADYSRELAKHMALN